jgi:dinuclear metal center YbgI/SA1388 family protein
MTKIKALIAELEAWAPPVFQESYDNARLITGNRNDEVRGVLISLDCTEAVVDEAIEKGCNMIVAHHPIVFSGLKSLTGSNYIERTVIQAIKNDIAIYAIHTNLDHVHTGVNAKISEKLGLKNTHILAPKKDTLMKLTVFVPDSHLNPLLEALSVAGAGKIGNYEQCSFVIEGMGTFKPNEAAKPYSGASGELSKVPEKRIEVIFPKNVSQQVLTAMRKAHPYEEVAYYLHELVNENQEIGAGMIGELDAAMNTEEFLQYLKDKMALKVIRYSSFGESIKKVAVCGGAGSFLLQHALRQGADAFVTADYKYHQFFDGEKKILIADIGHYESEVFTKDLICEYLKKKFTNIALHLSGTHTNPVNYYF